MSAPPVVVHVRFAAVTCGHCGFDGQLDPKELVELERGIDTHEGDDWDWAKGVRIAVCPVCKEPSLWTWIWHEGWGDPPEDVARIYPTPRDHSVLPERVKTRLDEALRVRKISPDLYAVQIRRTLEAIANDKEAVGENLFQKLDDLAAKGVIPETLANIAHELRELGNLGAHDAEISVEPADVPVIEGLLDALLEHLYLAPAKLEAVKNLMDQRLGRTDADS
jgi:hypothetical protein